MGFIEDRRICRSEGASLSGGFEEFKSPHLCEAAETLNEMEAERVRQKKSSKPWQF